MQVKSDFAGFYKLGGVFVFLFLFIQVTQVYSQFYEYGQVPPSVKWKTIEGNHFKVIYPEEIQREAFKTLVTLEKNYFLNSQQLNHEPVKVPLILHNHTVRSNGFVSWAPKRMEFFMFPDVNSISHEWSTHLALHEFRHVVQVDKLNQGITKFLTTLLGEQGIGPAVAMVPFWFLEGDAIYAETSLSESGRGRSPEFEMRIKAHLLQDKKPWSYSKSYLGSYKNYVPDYYQYGYQMVTYGREKYGEELWPKILRYTGRNPWLINPFSLALKKETGRMIKGLYDSTVHHIKNHWEEQYQLRQPEEYPLKNNKKKKLYTSYNFPQLTEEGEIIAVKSGLDIIDRLVKIDAEGNEEIIYIPGILYSGRISYSRNRIIWDEYQPDFRWINKSSSILKEYNMESGKMRIISMNSRYSSPDYSYSGDTIVAVETTLSNDFNLVFISALDGGVFNKVPSPDNIQLLDPAWVDKSDKIVAIGLDERGKQLILYDRSKDEWEELLWTSEINIYDPVSQGDYIYFTGTFAGVNDIYAYHLGEGQLFRLTQSRFGAFQPDVSADGKSLVFADYTSMGYNIVSKELKMEEFNEYRQQTISEQPFFRYGDASPELKPVIKPEVDASFQPVKYNKLKSLFKFHSWAPFYFDYTNLDLENPSINPGITLLSQNMLSTAVSMIGYEYKEGDHYLHTSFTYKGWLPVIDISYNFGGLPTVVPYEEVPQPERVKTSSNISLNTWIPLTLYSGKWITGFQPSLRVSYQNDYFYYVDDASYKKGITYTEPRLYFYTYQRTAYRDLQPRFGLILDYKSIAAPFEDEQRGSNRAFRSTLYLPGIIRGQGLKLKAEWQQQNPERYLFGNILSFARGFDPLIATALTKYSADYAMPLLYPDLDLKGVLYITRLRANLFTDYIYGEDMRIFTEEGLKRITGSYRSAGIELNIDYHIFRALFPISSGVRASYLENTGEFNFEFLFNIYLNRF
ncbi:MAG: TolB family protein [Bacteroidales bacterium]